MNVIKIWQLVLDENLLMDCGVEILTWQWRYNNSQGVTIIMNHPLGKIIINTKFHHNLATCWDFTLTQPTNRFILTVKEWWSSPFLCFFRGLFTSVFGLVVGGPFCSYQHILHTCTALIRAVVKGIPDWGSVFSCECMCVYVCGFVVITVWLWECECAACVRTSVWVVDLLMCVWERCKATCRWLCFSMTLSVYLSVFLSILAGPCANPNHSTVLESRLY